MTIRRAIEKISALGYYSAAKWAVAHVLERDTLSLLLSLDEVLSSENEKKISGVIKRLENDEPMQYVLGKWQFIDIEIKTDARALIPRPETELLAQNALEYAEKITAPVIYDIGCGTGCIGLFLKSKIKNANVKLADISDDALSLAKENEEALGLDCEFIKADMLIMDAVECDIIVSNPPYIKTDDIAALDANVKDYEPHTALDGGADGLIYYRALAKLADASLSPEGAILVEVGIDQGQDVADIMRRYFNKVKTVKDFSGIDRMVIAERG